MHTSSRIPCACTSAQTTSRPRSRRRQPAPPAAACVHRSEGGGAAGGAPLRCCLPACPAGHAPAAGCLLAEPGACPSDRAQAGPVSDFLVQSAAPHATGSGVLSWSALNGPTPRRLTGGAGTGAGWHPRLHAGQQHGRGAQQVRTGKADERGPGTEKGHARGRRLSEPFAQPVETERV